MGISTAARGDTTTILINPASCADTAAATSSWIDIRPYKGELLITAISGAITGSLTGKMRTATDVGGTGAADITGATFTAVTDANQTQTVVVPKGAGPFVQYVGTVVTGPVVLAVVMTGHAGYV